MLYRLACTASVILTMLGCSKTDEISESQRYQISDCRRLIASFAGQDSEVAERSMRLKQLGCTSITPSETDAYLSWLTEPVEAPIPVRYQIELDDRCYTLSFPNSASTQALEFVIKWVGIDMNHDAKGSAEELRAAVKKDDSYRLHASFFDELDVNSDDQLEPVETLRAPWAPGPEMRGARWEPASNCKNGQS